MQEVDPPVVLLPQFDVVGSGSILLSQHCNNKSLRKESMQDLLRAKISVKINDNNEEAKRIAVATHETSWSAQVCVCVCVDLCY